MSRANRWRNLGFSGPPRRLFTTTLALALLTAAVALFLPGLRSLPHDAAGRQLILILDVSRSMAATDVWPSRLEAAITAAHSLVATLARHDGDQVGVVAFAGRAVPVCPLTDNLGAVAESLQRLRPDSLQPGGSNLGSALETALALFDLDPNANPSRALILFSDGEDHAPAWNQPAQDCRRRHIPVHTIALGDDRGSPIPQSSSSRPILTYRRDHHLQAIAQTTGGLFLPVGIARVDLGPLYVQRIEPMIRSRLEAQITRPTASPPALLLLCTFLLAICDQVTITRLIRSLGRSLRACLRRFHPVAAAPLLAFLLVPASPQSDPLQLYQDGAYDAALALYNQSITRQPHHPIPHINAAACLFQLGRFEEALDHYQRARTTAPADLLPLIDFALGNTQAALGRFDQAVAAFDACLAHPPTKPLIQSIQNDARSNRAAVLDALGRSSTSLPSSRRQTHSDPDRPHDPSSDQPSAESPDSPPSEQTSRPTPSSPPAEERLAAAIQQIQHSRARRLLDLPQRPLNPARPDW
ncbi:MAG: hypothetical protein KatS3mg108_3300 [Isosphaeraceae bacterium]|nr:MAG: hypothetical protein KatS3mg108_3300 [Isosphaeraceae bacterium]